MHNESDTKREISAVHKLEGRLRIIRTWLEYYKRLVDELIFDLELSLAKNADIYHIVDFSLLFEYLFPFFQDRGATPQIESNLRKRLRDSLPEQVLIEFFLSFVNRCVLLRGYAEEFKFYFESRKENALAAIREDNILPLADELIQQFTYFSLLNQEDKGTNNRYDKVDNLVTQYNTLLDHGYSKFQQLVSGTSHCELISLSDALEGKSLSFPPDSFGYQNIGESLKSANRSVISVERDINALRTIRALNDQYFNVADSKALSLIPPIMRGKRRKLFILWTKDYQLLNAVRQHELNVFVDDPNASSRQKINFCRGLDHLAVLYSCASSLEISQAKPSGELLRVLKQRLQSLDDRIEATKSDQDWLHSKAEELANVRLRRIFESVWPKNHHLKENYSDALEQEINSLMNLADLYHIRDHNYKSILVAASTSWNLGFGNEVSSLEFKKHVENIYGPDPVLLNVNPNPFAQLEIIRKKLDEVIARFDTPIWNRFLGFNHQSPYVRTHPFKDELNLVNECFTYHTPDGNWRGLRILFDLADKSSGALPSDDCSDFRVEVDPNYQSLLAKAYRLQGRFYKSIRVIDRALYLIEHLRRDRQIPQNELKELFFERALALKNVNSYQGMDALVLAKQEFQRAYELDPNDGRYVYELGGICWRPIENELLTARNDWSREINDDLFYSFSRTILMIKDNKKDISKAKEVLAKWHARNAENLIEKGWNDYQKAVFVLITNGLAYIDWHLALSEKERFSTDEKVWQEMHTSLSATRRKASAAYDIYKEVDNEGVAEAIKLHVKETLIRVQMSICELLAVRNKLNLEELELIDEYLEGFYCTRDFEECYQNINEEYSKFRRIYKVYRLIKTNSVTSDT
ncbi:MAG: hypothetical protein IH840_00430 [Candidatus Heimdallarchaeota archaeon]|nr:hypothetical protein [Candidatus Heimdallarchaeota archaeon]